MNDFSQIRKLESITT